jgi:hypothetical protein
MKKQFEITFSDYADSFFTALQRTKGITLLEKTLLPIEGTTKTATTFLIEYEAPEELVQLGYNHAMLLKTLKIFNP